MCFVKSLKGENEENRINRIRNELKSSKAYWKDFQESAQLNS